MPGAPAGMPQLQPGQRPTPEQIQQVQRRIAEDAQKAGMSVPQFLEHIKKQALEQRMRAQQAGQPVQGGPPGAHQHPHPNQPPGAMGRQVPVKPGPANPKALAVAKFLKGQDLKPRTCILNGERKDMFKGASMT